MSPAEKYMMLGAANSKNSPIWMKVEPSDSSRFILNNSLHALSQVHAFSSRWAGKILILHCGYTPVLWHIKDIHSALEDTGSHAAALQGSNTQIHTSIHILTVAGTHWLCDLLATFIRFHQNTSCCRNFFESKLFHQTKFTIYHIPSCWERVYYGILDDHHESRLPIHIQQLKNLLRILGQTSPLATTCILDIPAYSLAQQPRLVGSHPNMGWRFITTKVLVLRSISHCCLKPHRDIIHCVPNPIRCTSRM